MHYVIPITLVMVIVALVMCRDLSGDTKHFNFFNTEKTAVYQTKRENC